MKRHSLFSLFSKSLCALALPLSLSAQPEPDITFYGKVTHHGGGEAFTLTSGTLQWCVKPQDALPDADPAFVATVQLQPLDGGRFSYQLKIPVRWAVPDTLSSILDGLLGNPSDTSVPYLNTQLTLDGQTLRLANPPDSLFFINPDHRGAFRRLDLVFDGPLPDSDGDGLPDWWESKYATGLTDPSAILDPDRDGATNLAEYKAGTDPTGPNQIPSLPADLTLAIPVNGTAFLLLKPVDEDSLPTNLAYAVLSIDPNLAVFRIGTSDPITSFTQADIDQGRIYFSHTGTAPATLQVALALRDETPGHPAATCNLALNAALPAAIWAGYALPDAPPDPIPALYDAANLSGPLSLHAPSAPSAIDGAIPANREDLPRLWHGTSAPDFLLGSAFADIFLLGDGDAAHASHAKDLFVPTADATAITIANFSPSATDCIDLRGRLIAAEGKFLHDFLRIVDQSLQIDANGDGSGFTDLVIHLPNLPPNTEPADLWDAGLLLTDSIKPITTIFVTADSSLAEENLQPATVSFRRRGDATQPLTIPVSITGTATQGIDFAALPTAISFPVGVKAVDWTVQPYADTIRETTESIQIALQPSAGYAISANSTAVQLSLLDLPSRVWLEAVQYTALRSGPSPAAFNVRRSGPIDASLTVNFAISGKAIPGIDYARLPASITFNPAESVRTLELTPLPSASLTNGAEEVTISLKSDPEYLFGPSTAIRLVIIPAPQSIDAWLSQHGVDPATRDAFLAADPDRDGLSGLHAFAFAQNPSNPNAIRWPQISNDPATGKLNLRFPQWPSAPEIHYTLLWSADLTTWQPVPTNALSEANRSIQPTGIELIDATIDPQSPFASGFFRIEVSIP